MQSMVHRLPVLGDHEATDPAKIVKWAKDTLNLGRAVPKLLEGYNLLHFSVSKEKSQSSILECCGLLSLVGWRVRRRMTIRRI